MTKKIKYCTWCGEFIGEKELMCMHCGCAKWDYTDEPDYMKEGDSYKEEDCREKARVYYDDYGRYDHYR